MFRALQRGEAALGLPALGGLFRREMTPTIDPLPLPNRRFYEAVFNLAWLRQDGALHRVAWRDMQTEELGSVYESLLELVPRLADGGTALAYASGAEGKGHERKTTGSYYTPYALVQALLDSALDPVIRDRRRGVGTPNGEAGAEGVLTMTVCDPACGSGHFLLAAARRIAEAVARERAEEGGEPYGPDAHRRALREVVARCIFGVDRNDFAVELARVALWIETVEPGRPLGFLDANIRVGDSLLGLASLDALRESMPDAAFKPLTGDDKAVARALAKRNRAEREGQGALDLLGGGWSLPPEVARFDEAIRRAPQDTLEQVEAVRARFEGRMDDPARRRLRLAADAYVAAFLLPKREPETPGRREPEVPTSRFVWETLAGRRPDPLLEPIVTAAAREAHAFHWPLAFPGVAERGGFDVMLGNPPWERVKLQEREFFAARAPEIAEAPNAAARGRAIRALLEAGPGTLGWALHGAFEAAKRAAEAASVFARVPGAEGGRFALTGRGDVNTYALFAELFARGVNWHGRAGVIVPTGIATDATTAPFFGWLVAEQRLQAFFSFENEEMIFPGVHHAFKFAILTTKPICSESSSTFLFFARKVSALLDPRRRFTLTPAQIAAINPNTRTAPVFRSRADADLTARIYERVPVLVNDEAGADGNPWSIRVHTRIWHMAEDSHWLRTADDLAREGFRREDSDWVRAGAGRAANDGALDLLGGGDARSLVLEAAAPVERFVPLYEAKMIHQFDHRWATYEASPKGPAARDATTAEKADPTFEPTPRYWVPEPEVAARLAAKGWHRGWLMGWRDITNATNERTVIASAFPRAAVGHTAPLFFLRAEPPLWATFLANTSALVLDFAARLKVGGTHLTYGYLKQLPILPPATYSEVALAHIVPRVLELTYTSHAMAPFARDLGHEGPPFAWDEDRRAWLRAELDGWFAHAYGLSRDDLAYVLDPADALGPDYPSETFRVLKANEIRRHGEFRTRRLVLAAYDALAPRRADVGLDHVDAALGPPRRRDAAE